MAGQYLAQLLDGLAALRPSIDAALIAAGVPKLRAMHSRPELQSDRALQPRIVYGLAEQRTRKPLGHGGGVVDETVTVEVDLHVHGDETRAAIYEGVVATVLDNAGATLGAGISDATLSLWEIGDGTAAADPEVTNRDVWQMRLTFTARLQWSV